MDREIFVKLGDSGLIDAQHAGCLSDLVRLIKEYSCPPVFRHQMGHAVNDFIEQGSKEVKRFRNYQKPGTALKYKTKDELRRRKDEPCKEFKKTEQ